MMEIEWCNSDQVFPPPQKRSFATLLNITPEHITFTLNSPSPPLTPPPLFFFVLSSVSYCRSPSRGLVSHCLRPPLHVAFSAINTIAPSSSCFAPASSLTHSCYSPFAHPLDSHFSSAFFKKISPFFPFRPLKTFIRNGFLVQLLAFYATPPWLQLNEFVVRVTAWRALVSWVAVVFRFRCLSIVLCTVKSRIDSIGKNV